MKIAVGKKYETREGAIIQIVGMTDYDTDYPFLANTGNTYKQNGRYYSNNEDTEEDIVRSIRITVPTTEPSDYKPAEPAGGIMRIRGINPIVEPAVRAFDSGATRSADTGRYDPEGFLSPIAIERYSLYMAKNQTQADGSTRPSDNWQKGLPIESYMKGMWRHMLHLWTRHRGYPVQDSKAAADSEEDLCALLFNVQGMLHEKVKARLAEEKSNGTK